MKDLYKKLNLIKKKDYYIASLDCNLILKEEIKKNKKKLIEELSILSRKLIEKGPKYQVDFAWLTSQLAPIYDVPDIQSLTYNFIIQADQLDFNCYHYKYFDSVEKKIKNCKIFSPFSLLKGNGFDFERFVPPKSKDNVSIRLYENNTQLQYIFTYNYHIQTGRWYGASINIFLEATHYATTRKTKFDVEDFFGIFMKLKKKGFPLQLEI